MSVPAGGFALRISIFYGVIFLLLGTLLPFMPVWLAARGLDKVEIGIIVAIPLMVRVIFTPMISFAADRFGDVRRIVQVLCVGTFVCTLGLVAAEGFIPILVVSIFFAVFWTTVMPLTEVMAMAGVRRGLADYGRMRVWGSLTFILSSVGIGALVDAEGTSMVIVSIIFFAAVIVAVSVFLPRDSGGSYASPAAGSEDPDRSMHDAAAKEPPTLREAARLARSRIFIAFLLGASLVQASHAVYYTFGSLHWQALGYPTTLIGILWTVGVVAEIILFAMARNLPWHGPLTLIAIGAMAGLIRWTVTAFDPILPVLVAAQILHGLSFGATHLGAIQFISQAIPARYAGTAQGIYAAISGGLVIGGAMLASGPLYAEFGPRAYLVMTAFCAIGAIATGVAIRISEKGSVLLSERSGAT